MFCHVKKSCCFSSNFLRRADRSLNGASDRPLHEIEAGEGFWERLLPAVRCGGRKCESGLEHCLYISPPGWRDGVLGEDFCPRCGVAGGQRKSPGEAGLGGKGQSFFFQTVMALKRSPSTMMSKVPPWSSVKDLAMARPKPLPSVFRALSPRTKRSTSSVSF